MAAGDLGPGTRRILVYGVTGSGKTTLAAALSRLTGIGWHSVDDLTWEPGWVAVLPDEQRRRIAEICAGPEWILDSAYGDWLDVPLGSIDLVVALDYPRWFSLQRLVRRALARLWDREIICNGNRETLRVLLRRDSLLVWHFQSFGRKRRRMTAWLNDPQGPPVLRFRTAAETDAWLARLAGRP